MKVASLDLGSNSFLLLIAEVESKEVSKVYCDLQTVTRLGQGVHENRQFHELALKRAESCFANYSEIIKEHQVDKVVAVSTSAARDVNNKQRFIDLGLKYGIPIEIISGQKEAELTYYGSFGFNSASTSSSVVDVGGGSTEVIGREDQNVKGWSFDIGSVRLAEIFNAFDRVSSDVLLKMDSYIVSQLQDKKESLPSMTAVTAVAGTPTTLSAMIQEIEFDVSKVEGSFLSLKELQLWQKKLAAMTANERKLLKGVHPDRADVLVCGVSILKNICEHFTLPGFRVSCRGVRFGLAVSQS